MNEKLIVMGMEITAEEAVDLLGDYMVMCSLVSGHASNNSNWHHVREMAREAQLRLLGMYKDPERRHVRCSECGRSRSDTVTSPDGLKGYVVEPLKVATP